jgi:hypothetical protein
MVASVFQETLTAYFSRIRKVNQTGAAPARLPQTAEPVDDAATATGQAVFDLGNTLKKPGISGQNWIRLVPYGTGVSGNSMSMLVYGWGSIGTHTQAPSQVLWVPVLLASFTAVLGTCPGIAGAIIDNTMNFAQQISIVTGFEGVLDAIVSPSNNNIAHCMVDLRGFQKVEVVFGNTSTTDANALYALF